MSMAVRLPLTQPANTVTGSPFQQALCHQHTILRFLQELNLVPEGYDAKQLQKRLIVSKANHVRMTISQELDIVLRAAQKGGRLTNISWVRFQLEKKRRAIVNLDGRLHYHITMCADYDFERLLMNEYRPVESIFNQGNNVLITAW